MGPTQDGAADAGGDQHIHVGELRAAIEKRGRDQRKKSGARMGMPDPAPQELIEAQRAGGGSEE
jgi:hypothetical protein